jgi:drug/metabolite transporter (DMT)-like permease
LAVALAMVTALTWGINEWVLSRATKELPPPVLGIWMSLLGLVLVVPAALTLEDPLTLEPASMVALFLPGLVAAISAFVYLTALRIGKLAIVSPTVATSGGIAAVLAVVLLGERFSALGVAGLAGAVVGVVVASYDGSRSHPAGVGLALAAAVGFGVYAFTLALAADRIGPMWTLVGYRLAGIAVFLPVVLAGRLDLCPSRPGAKLIAGATLLETTGFVTLVFAFAIGSVAIVSVIMSQFAAVAVVLAAVLLREWLRFHQWVGVTAMLVSISILGSIQ